MNQKRIELIDTLRGITIISMIFYHFAWDLVYLFKVELPWMSTNYGYLWQQSICWSFIFISGFCWSMGRHPLRNGARVFGLGALISLITILFLPDERIIFGVLTFLGSAMILMVLLNPLIRRIPAGIGFFVFFLGFIFLKGINRHYLGFGPIRLSIPDALYGNYLTTYLGFPHRGFWSTDYFSLFPWIMLFISGYFFHKIYKKYMNDLPIFHYQISIFSLIGKYSIWIYLIHQPVLYAIYLFWHYFLR